MLSGADQSLTRPAFPEWLSKNSAASTTSLDADAEANELANLTVMIEQEIYKFAMRQYEKQSQDIAALKDWITCTISKTDLFVSCKPEGTLST